MDKNKITTTLTNIKERFVNNTLFSKSIPIALSVWILSLTAYYCINTSWLSFLSGGRPDTKELIADALKFHWVPIFLSRLTYVFYALILNFIALLMGNRILRWLKVDLDSNLNRVLFSIPLGWGIYSIGIFWLSISGLLYVEAVFCFLTLLGILSILEIKRWWVAWTNSFVRATSRFKIDKTYLIFLPVIIIFVAVEFVISFSPVWAWDALFYHLGLPKLYIKHHALVHVPGFLCSTYPAHTEMLYLLGLITSGETLSKLFSFSISSMFLLSIFHVGNRYFSKEAGYLAVVIMMASEPYYITTHFSESYVDTALGLFSLLGVYAFFMWIEGRKEGYLYLSIICCALAATTKIHGAFFVLLFFAGFLVTVKMNRYFLKKLVWCILAVGIIALPWYIRSWWLTGDPIFPFLYKYLGGKYWNEYSNACLWFALSPFKGAKSLSDFIRINKRLFFSDFGISSFSLFIVIFLIPALITLRDRNKLIRYLFFIALVYYIFFIFTSPQIRYFYVGLAILSIIVAHFIKTVWTKYLLTRIPIVLCIAVLYFASFSIAAKWIEGPFFAGLGVLDRRRFINESYFGNVGESYRVATWVNENLPQDSKILSWSTTDGYYLERECVLVNPVWQGVLDFGRINDASTFLKSIKELGITHLTYHSITDIQRHTKEFLDKCVSELVEGGKIIQLRQMVGCTVYSVDVPPDYFVLDGNTIRFYDKSQRKYLFKGWSSTEQWGTWSEGNESVILVNFTPTLPSPSKGGGKAYTMLIKATGFSVPGKQQSVKIYLDDNFLDEHTFTHPTTYSEDIEVKIPLAYIKEEIQRIKFVYNFTGIPAEHGMGTDLRQLAMGVSSIEFK